MEDQDQLDYQAIQVHQEVQVHVLLFCINYRYLALILPKGLLQRWRLTPPPVGCASVINGDIMIYTNAMFGCCVNMVIVY